MYSKLPSTIEVQERLKSLKAGEIDALALSSGVPISTLWKIRTGITPNPGLETVRKFFHLLPAPHHAPSAQLAEQGVANA